MNVDTIRRYATLIHRKRELEAKVAALNKEAELIEQAAMNELIDNGVDSVPVNLENGRAMTVYLQRTMYARPKDGIERSAVVDALKRSRLPDLISYNANTLSAWVRERLGGEKPRPLPPALDKVLEVSERVAVLAQLVAKRDSKSGRVKRALGNKAAQA